MASLWGLQLTFVFVNAGKDNGLIGCVCVCVDFKGSERR